MNFLIGTIQWDKDFYDFWFSILKGFDDIGRKFDADSNKFDLWQTHTVDEFNSKADCLIKQVTENDFLFQKMA